MKTEKLILRIIAEMEGQEVIKTDKNLRAIEGINNNIKLLHDRLFKLEQRIINLTMTDAPDLRSKDD